MKTLLSALFLWPSFLMGSAFFTLTTTNQIEITDFYTAQISIVARVYPIAGNSNVNNHILAQDTSGSRSYGTHIYWHTNMQGIASMYLHDGVNFFNVNSTLGIVKSNQWTHIAFTYDNTATIRVYVNGTLDQTNKQSVYTNLNNSTSIVTIGSRNFAAFENMFSGNIEDVAVFNRAITASEVDWLFRNRIVDAPKFLPGLISYWPLIDHKDNEDLTGQKIRDSFGSNHGTAKNTVRSSSNTRMTHR
jgi:hypothetical protein